VQCVFLEEGKIGVGLYEQDALEPFESNQCVLLHVDGGITNNIERRHPTIQGPLRPTILALITWTMGGRLSIPRLVAFIMMRSSRQLRHWASLNPEMRGYIELSRYGSIRDILNKSIRAS
jgi:hypothetical protein